MAHLNIPFSVLDIKRPTESSLLNWAPTIVDPIQRPQLKIRSPPDPTAPIFKK